jgi:predicted NBD/HSP70 family sugar kinase
MSEHLGGAMIVNRNVFRGRSGHSATFEHIQIDPNGKQCYCGKKGCFETVLSMQALLDGRDADEFFDAVRSGSEPEKAKWQEYLKNLAIMIDGIHLVNDIDYILGGHLAPYFTEEDIKILYDNIREICPFEEEDGFIKISKMPSHNINIGAALPYIKEFLENPDNLRPARSE